MAEQMRPSSNKDAPDPARSYERARPEAEAGMGQLNSPVGKATPTDCEDRVKDAVKHAQGQRQLNADDDVVDARAARQPTNLPPPKEPDHSMLEEEPDGWDLAPTDIHDPRAKRHPRKEGKGGTP